MSSHQCQFGVRDLARIVLLPLLPVVFIALAMHGGQTLGWFPARWPILDMDRAVLTYQAEVARMPNSAEVLLLGDSSCLTGLSVPDLEKNLGLKALSLATLSYVDLQAHGMMLSRWIEANPGKLRTVILLMHPEALRREEPSAFHQRFLEGLLTSQPLPKPEGFRGRWERMMGLDVFRDRILARILPFPLPSQYGPRYGFTVDLCRRLWEGQGSLADPNLYDRDSASGNAEYRLAKVLERASAGFRAQAPAQVRWVIGLTPSPASFVQPDHPARHRALLTTWAQWLKADVTLTNLPAILPDVLFASTTHLNATGRDLFTRLLARELGAHSDESASHPRQGL
ncbi:MAG TPA: hypothetical protein P5186_24855 [Candidatus Paceibacterota bacterium]|nr:hypothetical protein [Verrucomicrobiota bacterium]HRY51293.1 hypothetical protein [Candidatus Paceibacterota bacterium]